MSDVFVNYPATTDRAPEPTTPETIEHAKRAGVTACCARPLTMALLFDRSREFNLEIKPWQWVL